jgi:hypothetical protein
MLVLVLVTTKLISHVFVFMPSECEWVWAWMYYCEVAIPTLLGKQAISCIKQINTDGDRKIYESLTKLSVDKTLPWYGVNHCICAYLSHD